MAAVREIPQSLSRVHSFEQGQRCGAAVPRGMDTESIRQTRRSLRTPVFPCRHWPR
jgi:hypothetical protein